MIVVKRMADRRRLRVPRFRIGGWGDVMRFDENLKYDEVYEHGAILLTALAYPQQSEPTRSLQLYLSLCGKALWLKHLAEPDDWTPITVKPQYVFRDSKSIDRDVGFVVKRVRERMVAGRMAIPYFRQAALGRLPPLPEDGQRLSLNQMAEFVLDDIGQAETGNVEQRIWAPSRPVIHLATAAAIVGQQLRQSGYPLALESLLFHRWLVEAVARLAEELEALIAKDPKFPVRPEQLIRFRLG
jgi:hypothetical protein